MEPVDITSLTKLFLSLGCIYFACNIGYIFFAIVRDTQTAHKANKHAEIAQEHLKLHHKQYDIQLENKVKTCTQYLEEVDRIINEQLNQNRWILATKNLKKKLEQARAGEEEASNKDINRIDS